MKPGQPFADLPALAAHLRGELENKKAILVYAYNGTGKTRLSMAFKDALKKAESRLLEPMMKVEVVVPDQYMGDVIGDINSRRGRIETMEARGADQVVHSFVPLSEMFGYATDLRSKSQGRGMFTMIFDHYEEVPKSIADKQLGK